MNRRHLFILLACFVGIGSFVVIKNNLNVPYSENDEESDVVVPPSHTLKMYQVEGLSFQIEQSPAFSVKEENGKILLESLHEPGVEPITRMVFSKESGLIGTVVGTIYDSRTVSLENIVTRAGLQGKIFRRFTGDTTALSQTYLFPGVEPSFVGDFDTREIDYLRIDLTDVNYSEFELSDGEKIIETVVII